MMPAPGILARARLCDWANERKPQNEHDERRPLIQKIQAFCIMSGAFMLWQDRLMRRWIIWIRRSKMDLDSASGWRTTLIGMQFATSLAFRRCCVNFDFSKCRSWTSAREFAVCSAFAFLLPAKRREADKREKRGSARSGEAQE